MVMVEVFVWDTIVLYINPEALGVVIGMLFAVKLNYSGDTLWSYVFDYDNSSTQEYGGDVIEINDTTTAFVFSALSVGGSGIALFNKLGGMRRDIMNLHWICIRSRKVTTALCWSLIHVHSF